MKAFKVSYSTPRKVDSMIILSSNEDEIEESLRGKDQEFDRFIYKGGSKIRSVQEVPLSTVLVKDLSIVELLSLLNRHEGSRLQ